MLQRSQVKTLFDLFKQRATLTPKQVAYQYYDETDFHWHTVNWQDAFKQSLVFRNALAAEKLAANNRILLILENSVDWVYLAQAAYQLGLVVVAASPLDSLPTLRHIIKDCQPSLIFIETDRLLESLQLEDKLRCVVRKKLHEDTWQSTITHWISHQGDCPSSTKEDITAQQLAMILYTSGSSDTAKGVMLSHESILNNAEACREAMHISASDKLLNVTPFSHFLGSIIDLNLSMLCGIPFIFNRALGMVSETIRHTHPTLFTCTPFILEWAYSNLIKQHPRLRQYIEDYLDYQNGLSPWKISFLFWGLIQRKLRKRVKQDYQVTVQKIFSVGVPLSKYTKTLSRVLPLPIFEGYGTTEAGGIVSLNIPDQSKAHSMGKPLNNNQIAIDEAGLIKIKTNSIMLGYWQANQSTLPATQTEWLATNDYGNLEDGYLFLTNGRSSKIQLANGVCVFPKPIEDQLCSDSLFNNVVLYGEQQSKLTAICEMDLLRWENFAGQYKLKKTYTAAESISDKQLQGILFTRINTLLQKVVGAPRIDYILPVFSDWQNEDLLDSQGQILRETIIEKFAKQLALIYENQYPFVPTR